MTGKDDDKRAIGDATEVVTYEEAARRKPNAPKTLGRYKLDKVIAQGGMAEIWLASYEGPGRFARKVVLKRIRPSLVKQAADAARARNVEMFVREAKLLASLEHKNIVKVIELGVEPRAPTASETAPLNEHYIVMEYLEGLTLRDLALRVWQAKRPLPLEVAVAAVADACLGLDHAHNLRDANGQPANLVHRDISPDNLFLTQSGVTKLLDFGIAKREDWSGLTVVGELKGKVPYMAPEQLKGERVDARTDLFAVGVVLYWLLTGRRPFDGPSDVFTMKAILDDAPRPLRALNPQVPEMLETIVLSCLEKDPNKRISSAAALHDSLSMVLMGASGAAASASEVVAAALALPSATWELVPDVAAVPVQRWAGMPSAAQPPQASSAIPAERDISQAHTEQLGLAGRLAALNVPPPRAAPPPPPPLVSQSQPAVRPEDDAPTLYELDARDVPSTRTGEESRPLEPMVTTPLGVLPQPPPEALPLASRPTPSPMPAVPSTSTSAPTKRPSWKDAAPPELRDTVDLGLDHPFLPTPSAPAKASVSSVSAAPLPAPPKTAVKRRASPVRNAIAIVAGVVVALGVLAIVAVAVGAVDNPFEKDPVVVDAGVAVVDAGSAVGVVPVVPVVPVVVDAGVVAVVADAGVVVVDAGQAVVDAGVVDAVVDAGAEEPVDDPSGSGLPVKKPPPKKKPAHVKAAGEGHILVRARPWARVSVDGVVVGTTPFPPLAVGAGRHRIDLEHEASKKTRTIDVVAGQTATLQVDMNAP